MSAENFYRLTKMLKQAELEGRITHKKRMEMMEELRAEVFKKNK